MPEPAIPVPQDVLRQAIEAMERAEPFLFSSPFENALVVHAQLMAALSELRRLTPKA